MKWLFLRGFVPKDRDAHEVVHEHLETNDCMWIQLFSWLLQEGDRGEIWYGGGNRDHWYNDQLQERFVGKLHRARPQFGEPDVIFARGGFHEYHRVLQRYPNAIKIYYGAGKRFLPQEGFDAYDIALVDSPYQMGKYQKKYPHILALKWLKPAADNIMSPVVAEKKYDVCFPANETQPFKGFDFVYNTMPKLRILHLGNRTGRFKAPHRVTHKRVTRGRIHEYYSQCKVGIVCTSKIDSCPRVIPEMICCGLPVIVLDSVRFWGTDYLDDGTCGAIVDKKHFWGTVNDYLSNWDEDVPTDVRTHYECHLNLFNAAATIFEAVKEVRSERLSGPGHES